MNKLAKKNEERIDQLIEIVRDLVQDHIFTGGYAQLKHLGRLEVIRKIEKEKETAATLLP